jgi:hypothetical protein
MHHLVELRNGVVRAARKAEQLNSQRPADPERQ